MSEDNGYSSSLVSNDRSDETFKALLKHFEVWIVVTMISGVMDIYFKPYVQFGILFRRMMTRRVGPLSKSA